MRAAETQWARALAVLTEHEFPSSRGLETRVDAYLQLEDLQRLEDSEDSVTQLRKQLPPLLSEVRFDLQQTVHRDVRLAALKCLSYFMHHRNLVSVFSDEHLVCFFGELMTLLFTTQDQYTYKLCIYCLTMQNVSSERHKFLARTVEALVQAVVNPFKSRAIEVQALKGLHLLLVKYPDQLGTDGTILSIYVRPVTSRLSSRETSTRTQARLVLEEMSKHAANWTHETLNMAQDCMEEYVLPVMKSHIDCRRLKDAVCLWKLILVLLRSRFSCDLGKLNQVLYVAEKCMEDKNATVRLMAMQAWALVVDVVHDHQNWLFNKTVVSLLVWPVKLCVEQERLLNIVDTAFLLWRKMVSIAVQDFNVFCKAQKQHVGAGLQRCVPEWKFWYSELVISPLLTLIVRSKYSGSTQIELKQFIDFAKDMWEPEVPRSGKRESEVTGSGKSREGLFESNCTATLDGSSVEARVVVKRPETSPVADHNVTRFRITLELLGVALLLKDVFGVVLSLIEIANKSYGELITRYAHDLAMTTWKGLCHRMFSNSTRDGALSASNLGLRLVRQSIEFSFGLHACPALAAKPEQSAAPVERIGGKVDRPDDAVAVVTSTELGLVWKLQLLTPLLSSIAFPGDLQAVVLHPKCKLFDHITQRMHYLEQRYVQCATVLEKWRGRKPSDLQIDFSARPNLLTYLVINLLFEYAIHVGDTGCDHVGERESVLKSLDAVLRKLMECIQLNSQVETHKLNALVHFVEASIAVAYKHFGDGNGCSVKRSMLDELASVCTNLTDDAGESRPSVSPALDLHGSRGTSGIVVFTTASTAGIPSDGSDAEEKCANSAPHGAECLPGLFDTNTSSLCLLGGELSNMLSANLGGHTATSLTDGRKQAQRNSQRSRSHRSDESTGSDSALIVSRTGGDVHRNNGETPGAKYSQVQPIRSQSASMMLLNERTNRPIVLDVSQCLYPDLIGCKKGISLLYEHLPRAFRPFFSLCEVKTVGDLSALSVEKVESFGLDKPVSTLWRALENFNGRKECTTFMSSSTFQKRSVSTAEGPAILAPCLHKTAKRRFESEGIVSLDSEKSKRTKSSSLLEARHRGVEPASEGRGQTLKLANKITLDFQTGSTGGTQIACPGDGSPDRLDATDENGESGNAQEKMSMCTLKLLQHLRRSGSYMDKLIAEEQSVQSEEASLTTDIAAVGDVLANYHEAHALVSRLALQLQTVAEASSKRCRRLLDKCKPT
uniref:Telomere-associated protein Rif1 N-terminal domain-containing protein n=1 Tax=Peronospora matthiolae TaxID=2874970 RepID=A0AAV1UKB9_9STRA